MWVKISNFDSFENEDIICSYILSGCFKIKIKLSYLFLLEHIFIIYKKENIRFCLFDEIYH